jgi:GDP-D-mannose dehydratase
MQQVVAERTPAMTRSTSEPPFVAHNPSRTVQRWPSSQSHRLTVAHLTTARDLSVERVVHTSKSEVYGTALSAPIDEKHPLQGQSPYSVWCS